MRRVNSLEKTLMLGGIKGRRAKGRQMMRCLDGITDSMDISLSKVLLDISPGDSERLGSLVYCTSCVHKELYMT